MMGEQPSTSAIYNGDIVNSPGDEENARRSEVYELPRTDSRNPQIVLKVVFCSLLFAIVLGSGFVARITLHILLWHINPPDVSENSALNTLGGLLQHNCTVCSNIHNSTSICSSQQEATIVDETWIWAVFLVIVAPYFFTFMSTLFRICFKSNLPINFKVLALVLVVESIHSIGLTILAFFILPTFDPASASVVYLSVAVFPALLDIIVKYVQESSRKAFTVKDLCKNSSRASVVFPIFGLILQGSGIGVISKYIYMERSWLIALLYLVSVLCVSVKYWENFMHMGNKESRFLPRIKFEYQRGRTKVTCIANLWKITLTFIVVIAIFAIRTTDSTAGFKSLFGNGSSMLRTVFGKRVLGDDLTCQMKVPFIVAIVNILCDYLCYKAAKTSCVIYSQILCFSIPLYVLPIVTTLTLVGLMSSPDILKFGSCDLLFSEWCLTNGIVQIEEKCMLLIIAFVLLYVSIVLITRHVFLNGHGYKHGETARIFVSPFYCGVFIDLSLLLNRRRKDKEYNVIFEKTGEEETTPKSHHPRPKLYACATMWHETASEMEQLLKSIFRLDNMQYRNDYIERELMDDEDKDDVETFDFEAHIFFDDAIKRKKKGDERPNVNEYVETFLEVIRDTESSVYGTQIQLESFEKYRTPYEIRYEWTLPGGNVLIAHLKNKDKIRHKKRWSQVMYMYYALEWKLSASNNQPEETAKNTYILALDGDVDFEREAVLSLMRRMTKSPMVGAACGRIHPIGSGPMVWYQKFEYAISHWLQKATEHVLGCVLCSPGCFSLFRGSAILTVLETYTKVPSEAKHYVQYDQGEDRWLCTLLLKQGWKIEYCAESDAYTFAPEGFNEFYNQRRRWTPSTMANILDLIVDWKTVTKNNENISFLFIVYQVLLFISTILTPGTIFMLIFGAIILGFEAIPPWLALILNIIPVGVFMLMCLYASSKRQLQFAAILSCIYAIVMVIVMIGVVRDAVLDGLCSMTTLFLLFVVGVFVISAILHPKEFTCLMHGLLYFVAIPSMSMLLFLYSIGNLHNVSWGTRETKRDNPEPDKAKQQKKHTSEKEETRHFSPLVNFFCCNNLTKEDLLYLNMMDKEKDIVDKDVKVKTQAATSDNNDGSVYQGQEETTEVTTFTDEDISTDGERIQKQDNHVSTTRKGKRKEKKIDDQETKFWKKKIKKYLKPLDQDENKEKAITEALIELRNSVCLFVFLINAFLVTIMFALTQVNTFKDVLSIKFTCGGNDVSIVPISILFAAVFGLLLFIQFVCMLYHRISTLIHITAETKIREDDHDKIMNHKLGMADFLTNPITPEPTKHELTSDKKRKDPEMNRSVKMPENEEKITSIKAIVDKRMSHLEDVTDILRGEKLRLAEKVIHKWKNGTVPETKPETDPAIVHIVCQTTQENRKGGKTNKVAPQPSTMRSSSDSNSGAPPNGNLHNQEPTSGTDDNV